MNLRLLAVVGLLALSAPAVAEMWPPMRQAADHMVAPKMPWQKKIYGQHAGQIIDVVSARGNKGRPLVIFFPDANWPSPVEWLDLSWLPDFFVGHDHPYVVVQTQDPEYHGFRTVLSDSAAAIAKARSMAATLRGDSDRIVLVGYGSGALTAVLLATRPEIFAADGSPPPKIAQVIIIDGDGLLGPASATMSTGSGERWRQRLFGDDPAGWKDFVPDFSQGKAIPPFLVLERTRQPASMAQAQDFVGRLKQAGDEVTLVQLYNQTDYLHSKPGSPNSPVNPKILAFLGDN